MIGRANFEFITEEVLSKLKGVNDPNVVTSKMLLEILNCQYEDAMKLHVFGIQNRINVLTEIQEKNREFIEAIYPLWYMFGNMINNYEYVLKNK